MGATVKKKEEFVDPVCGMTVDPAKAAGVSERDGVTYYFCSAGCKTKFDAGTAAAHAPARESCCAPAADEAASESCCCGGAVAPVRLTASGQVDAAVGGAAHERRGAAHEHHVATHSRHEVSARSDTGA